MLYRITQRKDGVMPQYAKWSAQFVNRAAEKCKEAKNFAFLGTFFGGKNAKLSSLKLKRMDGWFFGMAWGLSGFRTPMDRENLS